MQKLTEKPQIYRIGKWKIEVYSESKMIWCVSPSGKVSIIRPSTYAIARLPNFIRKGLMRRGLLNEWKEVQQNDALKRFGDALTRYEKFLKRLEKGLV